MTKRLRRSATAWMALRDGVDAGHRDGNLPGQVPTERALDLPETDDVGEQTGRKVGARLLDEEALRSVGRACRGAPPRDVEDRVLAVAAGRFDGGGHDGVRPKRHVRANASLPQQTLEGGGPGQPSG
jgi:hypothetical protein